MEPTRLLVFDPPELAPGEESDPQEIRFKAGAGWIVGIRGGMRFSYDGGLYPEFLRGVLDFRMWFNDEEGCTVGTMPQRPGIVAPAPIGVIGTLSLAEGWTSYDVLFNNQSCTFFPFFRYVSPVDNIYCAWRNNSLEYTLKPTMMLGMVRERDCKLPDPEDLT
jgi:hypothetical protein